MVSKFSKIVININKVIDNRSTFFSGGVTSCTRNGKYFCHLSVYNTDDVMWKLSTNTGQISYNSKIFNWHVINHLFLIFSCYKLPVTIYCKKKHIIKAEMADSVPARSFSQGGPPTLFQVTPCALFQSLYAFFKKMYRLFWCFVMIHHFSWLRLLVNNARAS